MSLRHYCKESQWELYIFVHKPESGPQKKGYGYISDV